MNTKEIEIGVLHDMIQVNNARRQGYDSAIEALHSEDEDLKTVFGGMAHQSANYAAVLTGRLQSLVEDENEGTAIRDKSQNRIDTETAFRGNTRQSVLNSCELGEAAVKKAYETALSTEGLSLPIESILESQQTELRAAHNHIEELKNSVA